MNTSDPLDRFEQLAERVREAAARTSPPEVCVAAKVMGRIRSTETFSEKVFAFLAAGACVAAAAMVMIGVVQVSDVGDTIEGLLDIVPPIGL